MAAGQIGGLAQQFAAHGHAHFSRPRGGGGAQVRRVVDQGPVGLVTHGGDQRNVAGGGGAHHRLVIEAPEILQRPAAPRHDDDAGPGDAPALGQGVEALDGAGHLRSAGLPLHPHGPDDDAAGEAVGDAVENVADDRARGRGDHPDHFGQKRNELFAGGVEEALGGELAAALLQQGHEGADPCGLDALHHNLVGGFAREGRDLAGGDDLQPLLGLGPHAGVGALPDHGVDAGGGVLEGEIAMAGGVRPPPARDFAAHAHIAEPILDRALEGAREFGDGDFGRIGVRNRFGHGSDMADSGASGKGAR